jgi:CBS-domain-containing membrane protein
MRAAEIMTEDPITLDIKGQVQNAIQILQTLEIRHLPIVTNEGKLVGMVSDRDLRNASVPYTMYDRLRGASRDMLAQPISEVMSSDVASVGPEADVQEIIDLLLELKVGALPVVDNETEELLGIVSYVDVLRSMRMDA